MKILDKIGSWIDKLDAKIFGKENYQPLAGQGFVAALKTAVGVGIVLFLVQMFTTGRTLENWTAGICCCQTGQSDHRHAGNRKYDCRKLAAQQ